MSSTKFLTRWNVAVLSFYICVVASSDQARAATTDAPPTDPFTANVARFSELIQQEKGILEKVLDPSEKAVLQTIEFRMPNIASTNDARKVQGFNDHGHPVVQIDEAFCRSVEIFSDAGLITRMQPGFADRYYRYVKTQLANRAPFIKDAFNFAGFTVQEAVDLYKQPDNARYRSIVVPSALMFVIAHESAHHVLDHYTLGSDNDADHRNHEREADNWAIDKLKKIDLAPPSAVMALFPLDLYESAKTTHTDYPPLYERMMHLMHEGFGFIEQHRADLSTKGESPDALEENVFDSLQGMQTELDRELNL